MATKERQEIPFQCFILHFLVCLEQSREPFVGMPLAGTPAPVKRKKPTKLIGKLTHEGKICTTVHMRIVWVSTWISAFKISHLVWLNSQSKTCSEHTRRRSHKYYQSSAFNHITFSNLLFRSNAHTHSGQMLTQIALCKLIFSCSINLDTHQCEWKENMIFYGHQYCSVYSMLFSLL